MLGLQRGGVWFLVHRAGIHKHLTSLRFILEVQIQWSGEVFSQRRRDFTGLYRPIDQPPPPVDVGEHAGLRRHGNSPLMEKSV